METHSVIEHVKGKVLEAIASKEHVKNAKFWYEIVGKGNANVTHNPSSEKNLENI